MFRFLVSLICLLVFFTFNSTVLAHSQTQIIEMTPEGFSPDPVTVDENVTIIFVNKDTIDRWPASNVHPTHELYPEFDPKQSIKPGESWTFKPKNVGEWKYHDHNLPHKRGMIIVVAEGDSENMKQSFFTSQIAPSVIPSSNLESKKENIKDMVWNFFKQIGGKFKSLFNRGDVKGSSLDPNYQPLSADEFKKLSYDQQAKNLETLANNLGGQKTWVYIKEVYDGESGASGNIHDLAHLSGSLMYQKDGFSGLGNCSANFAFGCYHGFLDKAFAKDLSHLNEAEDACSKLGPENSGPVASCIHGIGHGVASFHSTKDLKEALGSCRKLDSGREFCFDGVFMEFVRSASTDFYKANDPLYPCNDLEKDYAYAYSFACGRNQPSLLMGRFNKGFDEVISVCRASDSKPIKNGCFDSLGFSLAAQSVDQIIISCQKISDGEYIQRCIKSAAGEMVFQEVLGWEENSKRVCQNSAESQECLDYINRLILEYNRVSKQ